MKVEIWHNPRCSKSRATLALLEARGISPRIRLYLLDPPTETEISDALLKLGIQAIALIRQTETSFKVLALEKTSPENVLIAAMAEAPILIERPIVFANGTAAIGRPPEAVLEII